MGGTITLELARRHPDLAGIVVMAAPVLALEALDPLVQDPDRPFSVPAPWSTVGVLTQDVGVERQAPVGAADSSHEVTLDVDRERVMIEVFDFIRARSKE
jgi:carboxylesterase